MAVALVLLTLAAAAMIVFLTTALHRTSQEIERSSEGVRVAASAKVDLIVHPRATSPVTRQNLAGNVERSLLAARSYVGTDEEQATLDEAVLAVRTYLDASRDPARTPDVVSALHAAAYARLDTLVNINVAQARAMARFNRGDHGTRVNIEGPRELQDIGRRFNEMAARIQQQGEQQRAFLAGVAHDLRNPVNALMLTAKVASADSTLPADHAVRRLLGRIVRQLGNMDRMIGDFVDASMVEAGTLELRVEQCDLREPVRSTVELFDATSPVHTLVVDLPDAPVEVWIDALRIEQVVGNLISNAIKYSPGGGEVRIRVDVCDQEATIEVSDRGIGMSPELREGLFEPFRRGLALGSIPGVGLGLYVTRRIVAAHGGHIEIDSEPGVGSTVRILLSMGAPEAG